MNRGIDHTNHLNILMKCIDDLEILRINHDAWKFYDFLRLNSFPLLTLRLKVQGKKIFKVLLHTIRNIKCRDHNKNA